MAGEHGEELALAEGDVARPARPAPARWPPCRAARRGSFMTSISRCDALGAGDLGGQRRQLGVDARRPAVGRVHEHERGDAVGHRQREVLGDHAAHRVAQQREAVPPERVDEPAGVVGERRQRVVPLLGRLAAGAVAPVVRRDRVEPAGREGVDPVGEVLLRAREPVDQQQPRSAVPGLGRRQHHRSEVDLDQLHRPVLPRRRTDAPGKGKPRSGIVQIPTDPRGGGCPVTVPVTGGESTSRPPDPTGDDAVQDAFDEDAGLKPGSRGLKRWLVLGVPARAERRDAVVPALQDRRLAEPRPARVEPLDRRSG